MALTPRQARELVEQVCGTQPDEMPCGDCLDQLAAFAQAELAGKPVDEALLAVREHLVGCVECREEYEALYVALEAIGEVE